jgi:PAS domain S-box-containing protein
MGLLIRNREACAKLSAMLAVERGPTPPKRQLPLRQMLTNASYRLWKGSKTMVVDFMVTLDAVRPTAERVIRLAQVVFGGVYADIVWQEADRVSRMVPFRGDGNARFPSQFIIATGQPLWIEDFASDPVALKHGLVAAVPAVKCFVGVPICSDGAVLGVLASIDHVARPRDDCILQQMADLAALLAEAFAQVRLVAQQKQTATLLQEALDASARSEQRLKLAAELAKVHVWELDHTRKEVSNDGAATPDGMSYQEAKRSIWDMVHPEDRPMAEDLWAQHLEGGPPLRTIYRLYRQDGSLIWVESAAEAVRGPDGQVFRVVGALRNIDAEKRREAELLEARNAAESANDAKSTFLATISHEIRTPLNGILGMVQAMAYEDLPPHQSERLAIIRQSGESLLAIVNDVLDLSKIGSGKLTLESIPFDLVELTAGASATFAAVADGKGLEFSLDGTRAPGMYQGDPVRVRQILYNLISNALKFTEAGSVRVLLERTHDGLRLQVADTGVGIPADRLNKLFEPFIQADASTTRRFGGTGLGLSICKELAVQMGGQVTVESVFGRGSTFIVDLPLPYLGSTRESGDEPAALATEAEDLSQLRVLAAEDNRTNQIVLQALLGHVGVVPVVVENGRLAVEAWVNQTWDLILMDAQMPEMDGVQATKAIREMEQATGRERTPIIALTANALSHHADEYLKAGMDGFVAKPIQVTQLFAAIQACLDPTFCTAMEA